MYNVFVSYLREDNMQALRLAHELESSGAVVWVDVSDLLTGAPWREEIAEAIRQAEFFLACFSSTCEKRPDNGMLDELKYAIRLRQEGQEHPEILPAKLNACNIPDLQIDSDRNLNDLHWSLLDDQNWKTSVKQLVEITLRKAKERAKISLDAEAEEVAVKHAQLVRAREELTTHEGRVIRQNINREMQRSNSRPSSMEPRSFEPPSVWRAQLVARREMEYEYALSEYRKHQVEFVERFGEDYHPLFELSDEMDEEEKRIHQSFEDARRAEEESIEKALKGAGVLLVFVAIAGIVLGIVWRWLKSALGF